MKSALLIAALMAGTAHAQFQDDVTCYTWQGGYKSAGSFTKCQGGTTTVKVEFPPPPTPAVEAHPVAPPPIIVHERCPEPVKPKPRKKWKPAPKPICK